MMQMNMMRLLAIAAAAACACGGALAAPLDLATAYRLAREQDATIRQSRAVAEAGRERLPQARAQLLPNVQASTTRGRDQLQTKSVLGDQSQSSPPVHYQSSNDSLTVRQPIYHKQLFAQYDQAKAAVADANAQLERDEQTLVMRVTEAYFNVLLADEQGRLLEVQKQAYQTQLDAAQKGFRAGTGTRTDIDEAQSRLDMTIAQQLEARQNSDFTRRRLQVLVNQPVTDISPVDVAKLQLTPPMPDDLDHWTAAADAASPEVDSARAQVAGARAQVETARAGHYPTLDAYAQFARTENDTINDVLASANNSVRTHYIQKAVGLQLTVPLFSGGYVNSQVREALARLEASEDQLDALRRDLAVRVHQEYRNVTEGIAKIRALEQAVKSTEQLVVSSRRSFDAGVRTRLDILNAETQAGQARRDLAQMRFQYLLSRVRLRALAGEMRAENIDEINAWLQH